MWQKFKSWWNKYHNQVYGISGLVGVVVSIAVIFIPSSDKGINSYFNNVKSLKFKNHPVAIGYLRRNGLRENENPSDVILLNENGYRTSIWLEDYDFKLVTTTYRGTPCKSQLETISLVKKGLSPYLSIQSYVVFADTFRNNIEMKEFLDTYKLDVSGLYGSTSDVVNLSIQLHMPVGWTSTNELVHSNEILLLHNGNAYFVNNPKVTANQLIYSILEEFVEGQDVASVKNSSLSNREITKIAAYIEAKEKGRIFPFDCKENVADVKTSPNGALAIWRGE